MYTWVPIYIELGAKLLAFRDRQAELINLLVDLKERGVPTIALIDVDTDGNKKPLTEIDPFTFFASFNRGIKEEHRIAHLEVMKQFFGLTSAVPTDFEGIPVANNQKAWFFAYAKERQKDDIESLWKLAAQVCEGNPQSIDSALFTRCIKISQVAIPKLTMGMFWLNSEEFLSLDSVMRRYLRSKDIKCEANDLATYQGVVAGVREKLGEKFPKLFELSREAFNTVGHEQRTQGAQSVPKFSAGAVGAGPEVAFTKEDCEVFGRYPNSVSWNQVSKPDQDLFKLVRSKLKIISDFLSENSGTSLALQAETSLPTPNGRSPKEIWCCVFPKSVSNKSYSLQIALIISQRGAEVCFCRGSGTSQIADLVKKSELEKAFDSARVRLGKIPSTTTSSVEAALRRRWFLRKTWLAKPNEEEFPSVEEWLRYASRPEASGASISLYFSPTELQELGAKIFDIFEEGLQTFEPILNAVYPSATSLRHWIFQCNPKSFDIESYLEDRSEISWTVRQAKHLIQLNDRVLIWKSGAMGGVVAECSVIALPSTETLEEAPELWKLKRENESNELRCKLRVLDSFVKNPIPRDAIRAATPGLSIIKFPNATNFEISKGEYMTILSLRDLHDASSTFDSVALEEAKIAIKKTNLRLDPIFLSRFVTSLAAKPFVILTGNSGTGKTKLAQLFAHWLTGSPDETKNGYALIPVGADWTDNRNIVGFVNHLRTDDEGNPMYQGTAVLDLLLRARTQNNRPFFLILDEMNLSHVERYFADFLSAMESHKPVPIHAESTVLKTSQGATIESTIPFPDNLFVIGTVNVDETTYMFSPKVLDRANVIEFRLTEDEAKAFLKDGSTEITPIGLAASGCAEGFVRLCRNARKTPVPELALAKEPNEPSVVTGESLAECKRVLEHLLAVLRIARAEFAYRTMAEVMRYVYLDFELAADRLNWDWAKCMDAQILQKILPKLHGSKKRVGPLLVALAKYCEQGDVEEAGRFAREEKSPETFKATDKDRFPTARFKLSYEKLCEMVMTVRRDQFVSFIQ